MLGDKPFQLTAATAPFSPLTTFSVMPGSTSLSSLDIPSDSLKEMRFILVYVNPNRTAISTVSSICTAPTSSVSLVLECQTSTEQLTLLHFHHLIQA